MVRILYIGLGPLWLGPAYPQDIRHPHEVGQRSRAHLAHDVAAMDLHGDLADAEFRRNLLVHQAGRHESHDLLLARRQRFEVSLDIVDGAVLLAPRAITLERDAYGVEQFLVAK